MQYRLSNAKWGPGEIGEGGGVVYWSFATSRSGGFASYIIAETYRNSIRDAFQAWENVADIDFVEVADGAQTNILLGWDVIDGPFDVVGEASAIGSKTNSTLFSLTEAEIRFDLSENWTTNRNVALNEVGFYQVALHEIGHAIGLEHSDNSATIMYPSDISNIAGLTAADIEGAQTFYGAQSAPVTQPTPRSPLEPATPFPEYVASNGADRFAARAGDEVINGMGGTDTLSLTGDKSQYTLTLSRANTVLTDRVLDRDGTDILVSIERLDFLSDDPIFISRDFDIDTYDGIVTLAESELVQIVELYIAYFNRAPDATGLAFWGNAFADGLALYEMAALFIDQEETRATYPKNLSNSDFATAVYNNVLGRVPDAEGFSFWIDMLNLGAVERDVFILSVLEGAKAEIPSGVSLAFEMQVLEDRQYLSDKTDIGAYFAVHKGMSDVEDAVVSMALFDGSQRSIQKAVGAINEHYADALNAESGDFLMPLVGVLDDPFTA